MILGSFVDDACVSVDNKKIATSINGMKLIRVLYSIVINQVLLELNSSNAAKPLDHQVSCVWR